MDRTACSGIAAAWPITSKSYSMVGASAWMAGSWLNSSVISGDKPVAGRNVATASDRRPCAIAAPTVSASSRAACLLPRHRVPTAAQIAQAGYRESARSCVQRQTCSR
jgi:hypothetical protein